MNMSKAFERALIQKAIAMASAGERTEIDDVIRRTLEENPEEWTASGNELQWAGARRVLKNFYRTQTTDDKSGQLTLPGMSFPSMICIREQGKTPYYVPTPFAVLAELEAGEHERQQHIDAAIAAKRTYTESLDQVRPFMEKDCTMQLKDAVRLLSDTSDASA